MKISETGLAGLKVIQLDVHGDARGFFVERYNSGKFRELGITDEFVQDNHSRSAPGVLRGLHYQHTPAQGKLVGCVQGMVWDVAVDVRPDSPTFGKHFGLELSELNGKLLWMPPGFAHGFCVPGNEPAGLLYKVTDFYNPEGEGGISWDDPELAVPWPVKNPQISARDSGLRSFADYRRSPVRW